MTAVLSYENSIRTIFFNSQLSGGQMRGLHAAFGDRMITRAELDEKIHGILDDWKPAVLKRCIARAHAMFEKEEARLSPPPMRSDKDILKGMSHYMTIRITERSWSKLLWYKSGQKLIVAYEYDGGEREPSIPAVQYGNFINLGGSREAFIAFLESKGAKKGNGRY